MAAPSRTLLASRLAGFGTTIFAEMSALAAAHRRDQPRPGIPRHRRAAPRCSRPRSRRMRGGHNQYPPAPGIPALRAAIAEHQRRFYGIELDPDSEVLVTAGATEAIAAALLGALRARRRGRRVRALLRLLRRLHRAGRRARGARCTLRPPDYALDLDALAAAFTPRTRLLLLNSPHNPTGKVFTRDELELIAGLCRRARPDRGHRRGLRAPRVRRASTSRSRRCRAWRERTLTISSAGKTFSFTGWKIGWVVRPRASSSPRCATAKQFLTYVNGAPFQPAIAVGLGLRRRLLRGAARRPAAPSATCSAPGCEAAGFECFRPAGHLLRHRRHPPARRATTASRSAARCPIAAGVVAIPTSCSTTTRTPAALVRFAFCKRPEVLDEAAARLARPAEASPLHYRGRVQAPW